MSPSARKWMSLARATLWPKPEDNLAEALTLFFETAPTEEVSRRLKNEVYVTQVEVAVG